MFSSCSSGQDARRKEQVRADVQEGPGEEAAAPPAAAAGSPDDTRQPRRPVELLVLGDAVPPHKAGDPDTPGVESDLVAGLEPVAGSGRGGPRHDAAGKRRQRRVERRRGWPAPANRAVLAAGDHRRQSPLQSEPEPGRETMGGELHYLQSQGLQLRRTVRPGWTRGERRAGTLDRHPQN